MKILLLFQLFLAIGYASSSGSPSVIIVGAGMSGISAAKRLQDAGIRDFLILEATDRIGGRIRKTEFGGRIVELGANWLHGIGGPLKNPLFEWATQINLQLFFSDYSNFSLNTYKQEGGLYTKAEVDAALDLADENLDYGANISTILNQEGHKCCDDNDMSILALQRLHNTVPRTILERMIDFFTFDGEQAEPPRVTSLKHVLPFAEFRDFGEDAYFVADPRGFESLVYLLARQYLYFKNNVITDPRLKFNQVVRQVNQSENGVIVTTEDGNTYQSKYVILSCSLGVLQSDLISYNPPLPFWKRRSIAEFSIGIYTKIFMKFPQKFWPTGNGIEFFLYAHERRGYYPIWQQLEAELPGADILFVTVTDEESIRVEQLPDEETKAEAMEVLRKMFGDQIPEATDILVARWKTNRFFQGSFTNWPIGYPKKRHEQLRSEPPRLNIFLLYMHAPVGKIYFTGEQTHPIYFGYADGAYFSGIDTANDVIRCLKNKFCR